MYIKKYIKHEKTYYKFQGYIGTDPTTGKRKRVTRQGFTSKKECEIEFYRLKLKFEEGDGLSKTQRYTFQEVYDLWIEQYKNTVKESTLNKTLGLFRLHILPQYGNMYIDMIKVTHCQEVVNKWSKKLKKFRVMNNYTGLVLKYGMKIGIVKDNPTTLVTMPVIHESVDDDEEENYFTKEELKTFLDFSESASDKWHALFRLLAFSGCRKGEALALTWNDLDFKKNTMNINKTLTIGLDNKLIIQPPKTKKSRRNISIDERTMAIMKAWKSQQAKDMIKFGFNTIGKKQLVFTNLKNEFINPQKIGQKIEAYCRKAKQKTITPHGFRHTHCSLLFEAGVTIKEVQDSLGHTDIQTTMNIYTHVTEKKKEEAADKFAAYVNI